MYGGTIRLGDGRHTVQFYATDLAGLVETTQTLTVDVDTESPVTTTTFSGTPGNNGWYVSDVSVSLDATDRGPSGVASISYQVDGGVWVTYAGAFSLAEGRHTL